MGILGLGQSRAFASLKHRNFRWYFLSGLGMSASQGIQDLALGWLVLDLTGSVATLGTVVFARGIPMLVLGLFGGVFADRYSRKKLLVANQAVTLINMAAISLLVFTDQAALWHVYVSSALLGITTAVTAPARTAMIRSLVNKDDMLNAVALNSFQMNASRIIWPTMAGGLIALVGTGAAFGLCAIGAFFGIIFLLPIEERAEHLNAKTNTSPLQDAIDGLRYISSITALAMVMAMIMAVGMFGLTFQFIATAFAREEMGFNGAETGLFLMAAGVGSIIGSSLLLVLHVKRRNLLFLQSVAGFGLSLLLLSINPWAALAFLFMGVYGVFNASTPVMAQTIFQTGVPQHYLGRVNSLFMIAPGLAAILTLPIGLIGDTLGLRWALGGIAIILVFCAAVGSIAGLQNRELKDTEEPPAGGTAAAPSAAPAAR